MENDILVVQYAISKIQELKRKGRTEKEQLVLICTEIAAMKKEKRILEKQLHKMSLTVAALRKENEELRSYKERNEKHKTDSVETSTNTNVSRFSDQSCQIDSTPVTEIKSRSRDRAAIHTLSVHCDTSDLRKSSQHKKQDASTQTRLSVLQTGLQKNENPPRRRASLHTRHVSDETKRSRHLSLPPIHASTFLTYMDDWSKNHKRRNHSGS